MGGYGLAQEMHRRGGMEPKKTPTPMVWRAASLVGDESGQDVLEHDLHGEANASGSPSAKQPTGRRPRRLIQLVIGAVTLLVLLIGGLIGGVLYVTRDSSSETTAELRRPLPANPLNLTGQIGTPDLGRHVSPLLSTSSDKDKSENPRGRTRSADVETGEGRRGNAQAAPVETTEDSIATISAEGETEEATTERVPPPHPRLTKAERMVRLEAISPKLTTQVDRFDWARVPVESPLFRVFDETDAEVVPPGTNDIPLRGDLRLAWSSGFRAVFSCGHRNIRTAVW